MSLKKGTLVSNFIIPLTNGEKFELYKCLEKNQCILFFIPKAFTKGCTIESCAFQNSLNYFISKGIMVIGISNDNLDTLKSFKEAYGLEYEFGSDRKNSVAKLYDCRYPIINLNKRVTYLINTEKKVVEVIDNLFDAKIHIQKIKETAEIYYSSKE